MSQPSKKQLNQFDEYECGSGPRPPVPGEESQVSKMTTEGACGTTTTTTATATAINANRSPDSEDSFTNRVNKWQENLQFLMADTEGRKLIYDFVKEECGEDSIHCARLKFYYACDGLKVEAANSIPNARDVARRIRKRFLKNNSIQASTDLYNKLSPELREIIAKASHDQIDPILNIFDKFQNDIEKRIEETSYRTFLQSSAFISYVNQYTINVPCTSSSTSISTNPGIYLATTTQTSTATTSNVTLCSSDGNATASVITVNQMPIELPQLHLSSNLQTLHEDSELKTSDLQHTTKTTTDRPMPKLTKEVLLATQNKRMQVRPQGAHGYTYTVPLHASYNPVSRQDSERQSCSSASLTDSEVNSKDGKPLMYRKMTSAENYRKCHVNPPVLSQKTLIKPLSQGSKEMSDTMHSTQKSHADKSKCQLANYLDPQVLCEKLDALKKEMETLEVQDLRFSRSLSDKLSLAQPRVFPAVEDDDQSILDQHVSRVFSPYLSPGTISPKHLHRFHHRTNEMSTSMPEFAPQTLRHSKSIPEHASAGLFGSTTKRLAHKWPSTNIDNGISLYSADIQSHPKTKDMKPIEQFSDETMRRSMKDESRRTRKQTPLSHPLGHQSNLMPTSSSHHTNSLPRQHDISDHDYTNALYNFYDEKFPFRVKLPCKRPTLRHFKEYMPKKGNYRFFFTTTCNDIDNPVVQEEVINDADPLPLYEGKVVGTLKSE